MTTTDINLPFQDSGDEDVDCDIRPRSKRKSANKGKKGGIIFDSGLSVYMLYVLYYSLCHVALVIIPGMH